MKGLAGCLISVVVVIILGIIGIFAFFTISPQEGIEEGYLSSVISTSPNGKWLIEVREPGDGKPFKVYYGTINEKVETMSMIYLPVEEYGTPSADVEWKEDNVADIIMLDGDQEASRVTLTLGEE